MGVNWFGIWFVIQDAGGSIPPTSMSLWISIFDKLFQDAIIYFRMTSQIAKLVWHLRSRPQRRFLVSSQ